MFNVLLEKCADWLLPIIGGCLVWYSVHYFALTPRIITIDSKRFYVQDSSLPNQVNNCLRERLGRQVLQTGLMEAALYTATLKHLAEPYQDVLANAYVSLDETCGVSYARRKALEKKRSEAEAINTIKNVTEKIKFWRKLLTGK
ncbi:hypothetical protein [Glaciecola sp. MF2-115]|uniref:hypothetical protein n=1 Tax=Glaciecola sp. MF2-115 TaxID=3384827 RepID=UPI0039A2EE99